MTTTNSKFNIGLYKNENNFIYIEKITPKTISIIKMHTRYWCPETETFKIGQRKLAMGYEKPRKKKLITHEATPEIDLGFMIENAHPSYQEFNDPESETLYWKSCPDGNIMCSRYNIAYSVYKKTKFS